MRGIGVGRGRLSLKVLMGAAAILVSSTGCVARPEPSGRPADALIGRTIAYRCLDQTRFGVAMAPDGASVRLEGLASGPVTLPHVPSGSGARYSDERTTYRSKGAEATLELPGQPPRVCAIIADPSRLPGSRWRLARIQSMDGTEAAPVEVHARIRSRGRPGRPGGLQPDQRPLDGVGRVDHARAAGDDPRDVPARLALGPVRPRAGGCRDVDDRRRPARDRDEDGRRDPALRAGALSRGGRRAVG
jgi:membrane-bound inhibitor of C-type lysozyme